MPDAPRTIANIAMLRTTVRCCGSQLILAPVKLELCILDSIRKWGQRETRAGTRFLGSQRLGRAGTHDWLPNTIEFCAQAVNARTHIWNDLEFPDVIFEREKVQA
jgi:hypothetical protein